MATSATVPAQTSSAPATSTSGPVVPGKTLSPEERKKRYAALREKLGKSRSEVIGEAGRHYFWAAHEDGGEMIRLQNIGYRIEREPNAKEVLAGTKKPKIVASGLREDGTYVYGDCILTSCDMEVYEFSLMDVDERHEEATRSAKETFLSEAERAGVPTFNVKK